MIKKYILYLVIYIFIVLIFVIPSIYYGGDRNRIEINCIEDKPIMWNDIFAHNTKTAFIVVLLGLLTLGISTIFYFFLNIHIIIMAIIYTYSFTQNVIKTLGIFVHGFTEIISMLISYRLSLITLKYITNKYVKKKFEIDTSVSIIKQLVVMIVLLFLSSILEATISFENAQKYCVK